MKRLNSLWIFSLLLATCLWSCTKDENRITLLGGDAPQLTASTTTPELSYAKADQVAMQFNWSNPNYKFTTGISSQDVNYTLEIDTAGANFTNPNKKSVAISKDLSKSFTVAEFNDILLNQLVLKPGMEHNLEARIKSALGSSNAAVLYSSTLAIKATPYPIPPKVDPPVSGVLYLVGSATPGGWSNPVPTPSQQFTKVSETLYELTVDLVGGGAYLFIPTNGQWAKYCVADDKVPGIEFGGDFGKEKAKDIPAPLVAGTYKITVDFQRGKFTVVKQ